MKEIDSLDDLESILGHNQAVLIYDKGKFTVYTADKLKNKELLVALAGGKLDAQLIRPTRLTSADLPT